VHDAGPWCLQGDTLLVLSCLVDLGSHRKDQTAWHWFPVVGLGLGFVVLLLLLLLLPLLLFLSQEYI
jgi:hypothetical protein